MSELALRLIEHEKIAQTGKLDLQNCNLTELPEELFELKYLDTLILGLFDDKYTITSEMGINKAVYLTIKNIGLLSKISTLKRLLISNIILDDISF